ncbi:MAG: hypothetical protein HYU36_14270 [Planctomycetes bacterium]|nr:hypothetical protein [Planctomycetota bacterium]
MTSQVTSSKSLSSVGCSCDDREGFIGLAQANAVGKDTAVVGEDFVDSALDPVLLELEQRLPNLRVEESRCAEVLIGLAGVTQELLENMVDGLVINELRAMILGNSLAKTSVVPTGLLWLMRFPFPGLRSPSRGFGELMPWAAM